MKVIPKYQHAGKINWTRVTRPNGQYGYVRTNTKGQPVDFDEYSGQFKVYEKPDTKSRFFMTSKADAKKGNITSIQRTPDDHAAAVAQQKEIDKKVDATTPGAEDLFTAGTLGGMNNLSPTQWARRAYGNIR